MSKGTEETLISHLLLADIGIFGEHAEDHGVDERETCTEEKVEECEEDNVVPEKDGPVFE